MIIQAKIRQVNLRRIYCLKNKYNYKYNYKKYKYTMDTYKMDTYKIDTSWVTEFKKDEVN